MPYDEGLAERLRQVLEERGLAVVEKKMFGGLTFMLGSKMCVGIVKDELMVRVGPAGYADALKRPHTRAMDFTGTPLRGFVFVAPEGVELDRELEAWVDLAVAFVRAKPQGA